MRISGIETWHLFTEIRNLTTVSGRIWLERSIDFGFLVGSGRLELLVSVSLVQIVLTACCLGIT